MYPSDTEAIQSMKKLGYTLNSVAKKGEMVPLRIIESTASGGYNENFTTTIHPENIDISLRATKLFGLEIAGIDIISDDIKKPWHENGAIINEVNFAPLLGRGDISKKYIPEFLKHLLGGNGKIPIFVYVGESKAMSLAIEKQATLIDEGIDCFVTSHKVTVNNLRKGMILPFQSLNKRYKALLLNRQVEAIILVVQTDELLYDGLPINEKVQLINTNEKLVSSKNTNQKVEQKRVDELIKLFNY